MSAKFKSCSSGALLTVLKVSLVFGAVVLRLLRSLPVCAVLIVAGEVAVLAEAFAVVGLARVRAQPRLLGAASAMVAIHTHALRVVASVLVRAEHDLPLAELVGSWNTRHMVTLVLRLLIELDNTFSSNIFFHLIEVLIAIKYDFSHRDVFHSELLWRARHLCLTLRWLFYRSFRGHHGHWALLGLGGPLLTVLLCECTLVKLVHLFDSVCQKLFIEVNLGLMQLLQQILLLLVVVSLNESCGGFMATCAIAEENLA